MSQSPQWRPAQPQQYGAAPPNAGPQSTGTGAPLIQGRPAFGGPATQTAPAQLQRLPPNQSVGAPQPGQATANLPAAPPGETPTQRAQAVAAEVGQTSRDTPRLIAGLIAVSVVAALLLGAVGAWQLLAARQASLAAAHNTEQLIRVQSIQTALLHADAIATNAFLVGGLEPEQQRADYDQSIADASVLITEAAEAQPADRESLARLNTAVAGYAAQIELARSNNRQGYPIGSEYLREASADLRSTAMPLLDNLVQANSDRAQAELFNNGPTGLLLVGLLCLAAMVVASVLAARRFRRVLNPGLALGLVLMIVALSVGGATLNSRAADGATISAGSFATVRSLATARISGNDAKAYESLTLIARGSGAAYQKSWQQAADRVTDALGSGTPARSAWDAYTAQHTAVRKADDGGSWDAAVASATGGGKANQAFGAYDSAAKAALDAASLRTGADLAQSGRGTLPAAIVVMVLTLAAAVLSAWGLSKRMREYP